MHTYRELKRLEAEGVVPQGATRRAILGDIFLAIIFITSIALFLFAVRPAQAGEVPSSAQRYHRDLIRAAHAGWGLDAPIATFAAQVHQESRWNPNAISPAGAEGLAQFMPATSDWFAQMHPSRLGERQPYNPGWALRAMVLYNAWLFERVHANSPCDKWAMVLSAYNGGLGWVIRDKQLASAMGADELAWFDQVERFNAGRRADAFDENRQYPRLILFRWEPIYVRAAWGAGVCT